MANVEGKGRDDFELALLLKSESLLTKEAMKGYSFAIKKLA